MCLLPGESWEVGFCNGLVKSSIFVPILTRGAINSPTNTRSSFPALTEASGCDNVLLEHRLALEMHARGLLDSIYPLMLGDLDASTQQYSNYFASGCHPDLSGHTAVVVRSVEEKAGEHLDRQCLGSPLLSEAAVSVEGVMSRLLVNQGCLLAGSLDAVLDKVEADVGRMMEAREDKASREAVCAALAASAAATGERQAGGASEGELEEAPEGLEAQSCREEGKLARSVSSSDDDVAAEERPSVGAGAGGSAGEGIEMRVMPAPVSVSVSVHSSLLARASPRSLGVAQSSPLKTWSSPGQRHGSMRRRSLQAIECTAAGGGGQQEADDGCLSGDSMAEEQEQGQGQGHVAIDVIYPPADSSGEGGDGGTGEGDGDGARRPARFGVTVDNPLHRSTNPLGSVKSPFQKKS